MAAVAHLLLGQLGRLFGYLARDHAPSATHPYRFRRAQVKGTPDNGRLSGGRPHFLPQPRRVFRVALVLRFVTIFDRTGDR